MTNQTANRRIDTLLAQAVASGLISTRESMALRMGITLIAESDDTIGTLQKRFGVKSMLGFDDLWEQG